VKLIFSTIPKLILAMLVFASAAFFMLPVLPLTAQAQSGPVGGNTVYLCINSDTAELMRAYTGPNNTNPTCPNSPWYLRAAAVADRGICVGEQVPIQVKSPNDPGVSLDSTGTYCVIADSSGTPVGQMNFFTFANITTQYTPPGGGPTNTPGNTNNPGNSNKPGGNGNTPGGNGNTGTPPPTGGCETGFHKTGPLCLPNSPFNNGNSITGQQTASGLAVKIISILLYFAGIVAVIMAIIGGYQVMTAAGNETQATNGRKTLTNAIIGLVIVILSYIIIQAVINFIT
jgi:hypothetical protein